MAEQQQHDDSKDFRLERYKYLLSQQNLLNGNIFRYLALFQVLGTAIVGSIIGTLVGFERLNITPELAIAGIRGFLILFGILGAFVVISILAGVLSWFDSRTEESALLDGEVGPGYREKPTYRNFWRWIETYLILFAVLAVAGVTLFVELRMIPLLS